MANEQNGVLLQCNQQVLMGTISNLTNVISANGQAGIKIINSIQPRSYAPAGQCSGSQENVIKNAIIGTDANGSAGLGNGGDGIVIENSNNDVIGGAFGQYHCRQ